MTRTPVKSGAIAAIGYDPRTKILSVQMNGGNVYDYPDVPEHEYQNFMSAESKGSHLAKYIGPMFGKKAKK